MFQFLVRQQDLLVLQYKRKWKRGKVQQHQCMNHLDYCKGLTRRWRPPLTRNFSCIRPDKSCRNTFTPDLLYHICTTSSSVKSSVKTQIWRFWDPSLVGKQTKRLIYQDPRVLSSYWGPKCKCCCWFACKWRPVSLWKAHGRRMVFISQSGQETRTSSNYFFPKGCIY